MHGHMNLKNLKKQPSCSPKLTVFVISM